MTFRVHGGGAEVFEPVESDDFAESPETQAKWHEKYPVVAHALGAIDGRLETNSLEAFMQTYKAGQRVFEADFCLTSDNRLVVRHDFEQISYYNLEQKPNGSGEVLMDHETYMNTKINYLYTPLDIDALVLLLKTYPDAYLVTDTKFTDNDRIKLQFDQIVEAVSHCGDPSVYERIIVQIYHYDMFSYVSEIYPFSNWIFTTYQLQAETDYESVAQFCKENGIDVIVTPRDNATAEVSQTIHAHGIKVYYHTVNRMSTVINYLDIGADGFYSDIITCTDIIAAGLR